MKKCPKCNEWIGDNADVCFNCKYDFVTKRIVSDSIISQREKQRIANARQIQEQRINSAKIKVEQQKETDYSFQVARDAELNAKLQINDIYEYAVVAIKDNSSGEVNVQSLQKELESRSKEGWRLVNTVTNELGVNGVSVAGFSTNSTIEETVLIFERCIKRYR